MNADPTVDWRKKLPATTPLTGAENVTSYRTVGAPVTGESSRVIEVTIGGTVRIATAAPASGAASTGLPAPAARPVLWSNVLRHHPSPVPRAVPVAAAVGVPMPAPVTPVDVTAAKSDADSGPTGALLSVTA